MARAVEKNEKLDYFATSKFSLESFKKMLAGKDAVVEIRVFETLVKMANENHRLLAPFEKAGLISDGLELYKTYFDEVLEKMNIVDVISQLGTTEAGCNILCAHPIFKVIKKEALAKDTDPFVAKSLGILLIELVNHEKVPYTFSLFKDLRIRLEEMFKTGFGEELFACFDMVRSFGKSFEVVSNLTPGIHHHFPDQTNSSEVVPLVSKQ